jgi:hypothetical protein
MTLIELPRALEEYFAFAETDPTRRGRRFSITLPYRNGERLERLQWWYHVSAAEEQRYDGHGLAFFRARAIARFRAHIQRWLEITRQRLHGEDAIPTVSSLSHPAPVGQVATPAAESPEAVSWPAQKIAG